MKSIFRRLFLGLLPGLLMVPLMLNLAGHEAMGEECGCESPSLDRIFEIDKKYRAYYRALQKYMKKVFATPTHAAYSGYLYPSHGYVVLTDNGYTLGNDIEIAGESHEHAEEVDPLAPFLLFYTPTGDPTPLGKYPGSFTDQVADPPYRLIGWAYIIDYHPGERPVLNGIPSNAWFVHEAGWHLINGGFKPTPPKGEPCCKKGSMDMEVQPEIRPPGGLVWHQRSWDLHMWIGPDGIPIITYPEPLARLPEKTLTLPEKSFFFPFEQQEKSAHREQPKLRRFRF